MSAERIIILDHSQIEKKIWRISHEICERNYREKELILVGIKGTGAIICDLISNRLAEISTMRISQLLMSLDKEKPGASPILLEPDEPNLRSRHVILIDDVLNSGKTMMHAACYLLSRNPASLSTVAMIDRLHRKFPVKADYVGITLSTSIQEHVIVNQVNGKFTAYLE